MACVALFCSLWVGLAPAQAPAVPSAGAVARPAPTGSLAVWVDAVATSLEARLVAEGARGPVAVAITAGRGLDGDKVRRVLGPRLKKRLAQGGITNVDERSGLTVRLVVSVDAGKLWAVGLIEGDDLVAPTSFAVDASLDRELQTVFGAGATARGRSRWQLEGLGVLPAGVLDVVCLDVDGDFADEIVVLSLEGVTVYRYTAGVGAPEKVGSTVALPAQPAGWPRVVTGWLAPSDKDKEVVLATTAGHHLAVDLVGHTVRPHQEGRVPLKGLGPLGTSVTWLRGGYASPLLALPARGADGRKLTLPRMPDRVRDLWRTKRGVVFVAENGQLFLADDDGVAPLLSQSRIGDRVLLVDLDLDGRLEVATTAATGEGEADTLTLTRPFSSPGNEGPLFRSGLSGGSVVAMGVGDVDYDERPDLLIVEETDSDEALLWRLEYAP